VPLHSSKLKDRLETMGETNASLTLRFIDYNTACAKGDWEEAERVRVLIADIVDGLLDNIAAVYKVNDSGKA
jgi:hypothetical protein